MTYPTKAIYKMITTDYVKVSNISEDERLYTEDDITRSMARIDHVNYHEEVSYNGIKFWCYNAGHVLGAAMFMIEVGGVKILYTGDFSREEDRHLMEAELPSIKPDILIIESTYGDQSHRPRKERESEFTQKVHDTVANKNGRCLIPVFALGRAQELLLILEEHWKAHSELSKFPIYFASSLGKKSMTVFRTYIDMMNERIKRQFLKENPFVFKHIRDLKNIEGFEDKGPCVVVASPGMLQSGLSRQLFERWCSDKRNTVIIPGYSVEGTLAKKIENEPAEVDAMNGQMLPLKMSVHTISFSAHSDYTQTSGFIDSLRPPHIVLVHGNKNEMRRLKNKLDEKFKNEIDVKMPKNGEAAEITVVSEQSCRVIGRIANELSPQEDESKRMKLEDEEESLPVQGVLIMKEYDQTLLDIGDLYDIMQMHTTTMEQSLTIPLALESFELLKPILVSMFDGVQGPTLEQDVMTYTIYEQLKIKFQSEKEVLLEWKSTPTYDMIADSLVALLSYHDNNPFLSQTMTLIERNEDEILLTIVDILRNQFVNVQCDEKTRRVTVQLDSEEAIFDYNEKKIEGDSEKLKSRLNDIMIHLFASMFPVTKIPPSFIL